MKKTIWKTGILMILYIICGQMSMAKESVVSSNNPDLLFLPYIGVQFVSCEAWEYCESPIVSELEEGYSVEEEGEIEINPDYDLELYQPMCPFMMRLKDELVYFDAECEGYIESEEAIMIPAGCRFTFQVKDKEPGRVVQMLCPSIMIMHRERVLGLEV